MIRLPLLPRDNEHAWDRQRSDIRFAGVHIDHRLPWGRVEAFAYDLDESDVPELPTRDRDIVTFGGRYASGRSAGAFDVEVEFAWQTGTARSSVLSSRDLDHEAGFAHVEIGYSFPVGWLDRIAFQYDYADGDDDPLDNESNRFFTLFGARRFDFGPTGIYGPFARSNLSSPGLRATFSPAEHIGGMVALRDYRLASATDSWTTSGLRDHTGRSGKDLGTQLELRLRWDPNETWRVEFGAAFLDQGSFPESLGSRAGDSTYGYLQTRLSF